MSKLALLLALLALPPAPTRYVSDPSNLLEDGREHALNERLARYERETSNQLIVYVDRSVPAGTTLEEMGAEAIRTWAVGQEKKDNGAILFLFVDDRASRIEVGYGLEGVLTDARSKRILVSLRDDLRAGDYISAAEKGAEQIIATIASPTDPAPEPVPAPAPVIDVEATQPIPAGGPPKVLLLVGVLAIIIAFFWSLAQAAKKRVFEGPMQDPPNPWPRTNDDDSSGSSWPSSSPGWSPPSSSSSSSHSSSSSSGSSFSGGGGSGGGGGASDRW